MNFTPYNLFIVHAKEDESDLHEFMAHLRPLELRGDVQVNYDGDILPGADWSEQIKQNLVGADVVMLFITKDFFNSAYIEKEELRLALERHQRKEALVVPLIVKPCLWDAYPEIALLQTLPDDAEAIASADNIEEAWAGIAKSVQQMLVLLDAFRTQAQFSTAEQQLIAGALEAYGNGRYDAAFATLNAMVAGGKKLPAEAANYLGYMYEKGQGAPVDLQQAIQFYTASANGGNLYAQNNLGILYSSDLLGSPDYPKAVFWYRKSAEQGYSWAQNNLGYLYLFGQGIGANYEEAFEWLSKAARQENPLALANLGYMYHMGLGLDKDHNKAFNLYQQSAQLGNQWGQNNLGSLYEGGLGVEKDLAKAVEYYQLAAAQGNPVAIDNLARLNNSPED